MEGEIIVVTATALSSNAASNKESHGSSNNSNSGGINFINLSTGTLYSQQMKNCLCPTQGITTAGGISSFSGRGGCGDYLIAAQSKKPQINIWQWGKPHALMQCHIQEITTAIATDLSGFYLCGGTKGGRLFIWELASGSLIRTWQAHFKTVTTVTFTTDGNFLISTSEDGMVRVWDLINILNTEGRGQADNQVKSFSPYRSWTPHTLSVTGLVLLSAGGPASAIRVLTTSLDRTVAIYDLHSNRLLTTKSFPESLTCCTANPSYDFAYLGSMSGIIYTLALSHVAVILSEAQAKLTLTESRSSSTFPVSQRSSHTLSQFIGHDKPITALSHSRDNVTLVSSSQDGHVRIWNTISRQCMFIVDPFSLAPINNAFIVLKSEVIDPSGSQEIHRPTLAPLGHLKKYKSSHPHSNDTNESSQSTESKIGTRISFVTNHNPEAQHFNNTTASSPFDFFICNGDTSDSSESLPYSAPGFVQLPKETMERGVVQMPSKIRRQDTFGDEFYESWEKNVSVEEELVQLQKHEQQEQEQLEQEGFLSFNSEKNDERKRYREEDADEVDGEGEGEGDDQSESESDTSEDETISLRNEVEKWKQAATELQDQVNHLRSTNYETKGNKDEIEQQKRKKVKRGLRYHQALSTLTEQQGNELTTNEIKDSSSLKTQSPSRQSKALPPKMKPSKLRNSSS